MNPKENFKSLFQEFDALKNRVRNLIELNHLPSDGAWKESVVKSILRRHLPSSVKVGSGFIVNKDGVASSQIDVLIYMDCGPLLFQDGDFVIITSDLVLGVIEVKTCIDATQAGKVLMKLDAIGKLIGERNNASAANSLPHPFLGLIAYEFQNENINTKKFLKKIDKGNGSFRKNRILCICLGSKYFVRHWSRFPDANAGNGDGWRFYDLDETAYGYFIHNVIEHCFPDSVFANSKLWFPGDGKESNCMDSLHATNSL